MWYQNSMILQEFCKSSFSSNQFTAQNTRRMKFQNYQFVYFVSVFSRNYSFFFYLFSHLFCNFDWTDLKHHSTYPKRTKSNSKKTKYLLTLWKIKKIVNQTNFLKDLKTMNNLPLKMKLSMPTMRPKMCQRNHLDQEL